MAIETDRSGGEASRAAARDVVEGWTLAPVKAKAAISSIASRLWRTLVTDAPLVRFVSATLARRIFVSNLLGLVVLLGGMLWLNQHQAWLIGAKVESLKIQGEIIAAAIASNATIDTDRLAFDQDRLPEADGRRMLHRDDGFVAMELSLRPDRVA